MRKILLLLSIFLLFGCTRIDKYGTDYYKNVESLLGNKNNFISANLKGFKLYVPKGMIIKETINNNVILSCENTKLYLYVDLISYFYKNDIVIDNVEKYDYYKKIDDNGFLVVDENNGYYFVALSYNFSIIEFYSTKENIPLLLTNSTIILNEIEFNDFIIEKDLINNNNSSEKKYKIEDFEKKESSFSKYLNSYVEETEEKNILPD